MAIQKPLTRFEYDLLDEETGKYFGTMVHRIHGINQPMPYRVGDDIPLTDHILTENASSNFKSCSVRKIIQDELLSYHYTFYLRPTQQEFKPFGYLDWQKISKNIINGIDWCGLDGWLQIESK